MLKPLLKLILYPRFDGYGMRERIMFWPVALTGALPGSAQLGLAIPARLMPCCLHAVYASPGMSMNCTTCFFTPGFDSGGFGESERWEVGVRLPPFVALHQNLLPHNVLHGVGGVFIRPSAGLQ